MGFNTQATIQDSTDVDHQQTANRTHDGDDIIPASVSTVDGEITGETLIQVESSGTGNASAGTETLPFDSVQRDNRGEYSGVDFVPDKPGQYIVTANMRVGNTEQDDTLTAKFVDIDSNTDIRFTQAQAVGSTDFANFGWVVAVDAGTSYRFIFVDEDSNFAVRGNPQTIYTILRSPVQF